MVVVDSDAPAAVNREPDPTQSSVCLSTAVPDRLMDPEPVHAFVIRGSGIAPDNVLDPEPTQFSVCLSVAVPVGASNTVLSGGFVPTASAAPAAVNREPVPTKFLALGV